MRRRSLIACVKSSHSRARRTSSRKDTDCHSQLSGVRSRNTKVRTIRPRVDGYYAQTFCRRKVSACERIELFSALVLFVLGLSISMLTVKFTAEGFGKTLQGKGCILRTTCADTTIIRWCFSAVTFFMSANPVKAPAMAQALQGRITMNLIKQYFRRLA